MNNRTIVILAAGKGTRMNSDLPKVLFPLNNKPLIHYVIEAARALNPDRIQLVIGYQHEKVVEATQHLGVTYAFQHEQLGTGHALAQAEECLSQKQGNLLVLCGDVPLITSATLEKLWIMHTLNQASATILSAHVPHPFGYGRIIRNEEGACTGIIEEKDASEQVKEIHEINSGIYIFSIPAIREALASITSDNAQQEYLLTDAIAILAQQKKKVQAFPLQNNREIHGINTPEQLKEAEQFLESMIRMRPVST